MSGQSGSDTPKNQFKSKASKIRSKNPLTVYQKLNLKQEFKKEQVLQLLRKTPAEHIYKRPAKGGGEWEYVTGTYVKKVLNYVFGFLWSTQIFRIEEKHGQVVATVRLTIHKPDGSVLVWKEDIGKKDVVMKKGTTTPLDYGNDEKAAITDGIKRCAAQFGVASDIYGKEEFKQLELETVAGELTETSRVEIPDGYKPATEMQINSIKAMLKNLGLADAKPAVVNFEGMTRQQAADTLRSLATQRKAKKVQS